MPINLSSDYLFFIFMAIVIFVSEHVCAGMCI